MDMAQAIMQHNLDVLDTYKAEEDLKLVMVAPAGDALPDDGVLHYSVATNVSDLINAKDGGILLFEEKKAPLLEMLVKYQTEFDCRVKTLEGLPNSTYASWFTGITWTQDGVSYAGFLSELSLAASAERELIEKNMSKHDKEKQQYTRSNGTVKDQTRFDVLSVDDGFGEGAE